MAHGVGGCMTVVVATVVVVVVVVPVVVEIGRAHV